MGVRRNFSRGGQRRHFAYPFSGCETCNANGPSQNALPFLDHEETSPWKHALRSHIFEIAFRWSCIRVCEKVVLFCHPLQLLLNWGSLSSNIIIIVNYRQLSLNWSWTTHNCVCDAHISLCELNLSSQNLVWNVFYTLAIRNAFSFHKLVNVHFSSTFWT